MSTPDKNDTQTDSDVITQTQDEIFTPKLSAVIMHNDDYTTMNFVVFVLIEIFEHTAQKAQELMLQIHQTGQAVVAILPYEIAEMKVEETTLLAEERQFPLSLSIQDA